MSQLLHLSEVNYFDNCATTRVTDEVAEIVKHFSIQNYFNPSAQYAVGVSVANEVENARQKILQTLGSSNGRLVFTSGGTEAINLGIRCINPGQGKIISTLGEHSAAYTPLKQLKDSGCDVEFLGLNSDGSINISALDRAVSKSKTAGIVISHVNSETGAVNDVAGISRLVKSVLPNCVVVCDGVQAVGKIAFCLDLMNVDAYALSGHKIHAPKGIGALWVKNINKLKPLILGASQEYEKRGGTLNVSGIMALGRAIEDAVTKCSELAAKFVKFKQLILERLKPSDFIQVCTASAPSILTLAFASVQGETLMHMLAQKQQIVGIGSACNSKIKLSRGIQALNLPDKYQSGVIRISFSRYNDLRQVEKLADEIFANLSQIK